MIKGETLNILGMRLKKEYIVIEIAADPSGGPYVLISLSDPRELRESSQPRFGPQAMTFTSMEDLMKNLQRTFTNLSRHTMGRFVTTVKLDVKEYEESGLKVGDKVYLEITKVEKEGV
ncbi:MAG: hypothetical protein L6M37_04375 [Candidatus Methylarchaceae archaeon HK02M1]|nr:hypothetical protein [Candidatus Methylarchaceae archaeon HK02M1]